MPRRGPRVRGLGRRPRPSGIAPSYPCLSGRRRSRHVRRPSASTCCRESCRSTLPSPAMCMQSASLSATARPACSGDRHRCDQLRARARHRYARARHRYARARHRYARARGSADRGSSRDRHCPARVVPGYRACAARRRYGLSRLPHGGRHDRRLGDGSAAGASVAGLDRFPLILLGLFPAGAFPTPIQGLITLLPPFSVTELSARSPRGAGLSKLSTDLLALIVWGLAIVVASGRAFRLS